MFAYGFMWKLMQRFVHITADIYTYIWFDRLFKFWQFGQLDAVIRLLTQGLSRGKNL